jgi:excisionase family DNA binding protein
MADAMERIPVSRNTMQRMVSTGTLRSIKIGARRFIPETAVNEYLERLQTPA